MSQEPMKQMIQGMLANLEKNGVEMDGLSLDDLRDAMSHPKAPEFLAEWMPVEAESVAQGEPAPDFTLPYLPGQGMDEGETMSLASHFGSRPVGLIFGSYT
jgi:hypothetical protein